MDERMRLPRLVFLAVVTSAVAAQLAAVGCSSSGGGGSTTTGSGGDATTSSTTSFTVTATTTGTVDCGLHSGAPACDQCLKGLLPGCCDVAQTCAETTGCADYIACASQESLAATCPTAGQTEAEDFFSCLATSCAALCGVDPDLPGVPGGVGSPCVSNAHCPGGFCSGLGYCSAFCAGDDDCAPLPSLTGVNPNLCAVTASGDRQCFVGCSTQADCDAVGKHLVCRDLGGAKACTAAGDSATPPACQPISDTAGCDTASDCACGEQCFDTQGGSAPATTCAYACQNDADCVTASGGVYTVCLTSNGVGHCGPAL
jgi:hypothetical protein